MIRRLISSFVLITWLGWSILTGAAFAQTIKSVEISENNCSSQQLGDAIDKALIGEPVSVVTLSAPGWHAAGEGAPAYCSIEGSMAPIDQSDTAQAIHFSVALPAVWNRRAAQLGGGGMNGRIPSLTRGPLNDGYVTYGSDSGHQAGIGRGTPPAPDAPPTSQPTAGPGIPAASNEWALNDEAMRNLGYMQMKKTHDAAMVLIKRLYGTSPEFNYYIGSSQGGREALTVADRYPQDYNGIIANVPIVNFSSLMLAPIWIRIQEKPLENWVTEAKVNAIRGEFMRQCDGLDGLVDGIINNYMACRDRFTVSDGKKTPWENKRCPNNADPNPEDTSANACLTDGQIDTLQFVYSPYVFATPLANGVTSFGMWLPNNDPSGSGLIAKTRYRGQAGAAEDAPIFSHVGTLGATGFLMHDLDANSLDYVEGGAFNARRIEISADLDATNPDFSAFKARGGKMIVTIGTNDTLASPGAQLDFYQSVIDTMGRETVDQFARFFVLPQTGHGLAGKSDTVDGEGHEIEAVAIPNNYDRLAVLTDWVERGIKPGKTLLVTAGERSLPLCSYPEYPRYIDGPKQSADSYQCSPK